MAVQSHLHVSRQRFSYPGRYLRKSGCCNPTATCRQTRATRSRCLPSAVHAGPAEVSTGAGALPGSVRRVRVSRHAAALEVLRRVTHQAQIALPTPPVEPGADEDLLLRFPALEFRSLLLNVIGRASFPDRAVWKRYRVALCWLLLYLSDGDVAAYTQALDAVVEDCIEQRTRAQQSGRVRHRPQRQAGQRRRLGQGKGPAALVLAAGEVRASDVKGVEGTAAATPSSSVDGSYDCGSSSGGSGSDSCWGSPSCSADDVDMAALQLQVQVQAQALAEVPNEVGHYRATLAEAAAPSVTATDTQASGVGARPASLPGNANPAASASENPGKRPPRDKRAALRARIDAWCRNTVAGVAPDSGAPVGAAAAAVAGASSPCALATWPPATSSACASASSASASTSSSPASPSWEGASGAAGSAFAALRPLLEQVLLMGEPAPLVDIRRNGAQTELQVASLMESELPEGWQLLSQATFLQMDGAAFPARKHVKGEADLLLVDPEGVVQALVEVKTAKGNPIVALYEDVDKLLGLLRLLRSRTVTVRHGSSMPQRIATLTFSSRLRPIYVLGCGGPGLGLERDKQTPAQTQTQTQTEPHVPAGAQTAEQLPRQHFHHNPAGGAEDQGAAAADALMRGSAAMTATVAPAVPATPVAPPYSDPASFPSPAMLRTAWSKLLTMELGRELSAEVSSWSAVSVARLNRETVVLQVRREAYEPLARRVAAYFARLAHCGVFLAETSS